MRCKIKCKLHLGMFGYIIVFENCSTRQNFRSKVRNSRCYMYAKTMWHVLHGSPFEKKPFCLQARWCPHDAALTLSIPRLSPRPSCATSSTCSRGLQMAQSRLVREQVVTERGAQSSSWGRPGDHVVERPHPEPHVDGREPYVLLLERDQSCALFTFFF
jgi:hypothetical protein